MNTENTTAVFSAPIQASSVFLAAQQFIRRRDRVEHPSGDFDNAKRWYPDDAEECDCCADIRSPSRSYPFSLMVHCRSAAHVAAKNGVDATELRRAVREIEREND